MSASLEPYRELLLRSSATSSTENLGIIASAALEALSL